MECVDGVAGHPFRERELGQANTGHRPKDPRAQTSKRTRDDNRETVGPELIVSGSDHSREEVR